MTTYNAYRRTRRCVTLAATFCFSMTALTANAENEAGADARFEASAEGKLDARVEAKLDARAATRFDASAATRLDASAAADRGRGAQLSSQTIDRASTADSASVWSAAPTVETLLQLDTQAALVAERKRIDRLLAIVRPSAPTRRTADGMQSMAREPEHEAVVLDAIYGVGGALTAELTIDGERQRLRMRSRAKDARHDNDGDGIVRIDHVRQCVVLRRAGVERSACLTPAGASFAGDAPLVAPHNARAAPGSAQATPVMLSAGSAR
ncbi:hypothetical protein RBI14_18705 [Alcaligenaceae bacterium B3P038]|nr:hypothetical protein [Alcaligenaceae bacterium B3P038]